MTISNTTPTTSTTISIMMTTMTMIKTIKIVVIYLVPLLLFGGVGVSCLNMHMNINMKLSLDKSTLTKHCISALVALTCGPGQAALADTNTLQMAPVVEFKSEKSLTRIGTGLFSVEDLLAIKQKSKTTNERWTTLVNTLNEDIDKGDIDDAKRTIANQMLTLKVNIRELSKIASDGEEVIRDGKGSASFDYNTGQFNLKPMAKQGEQIFLQVNDIYYYAIKQAPTVAKVEVSKANDMFNVWYDTVNKALAAKGIPI